MTQQHLIIQIEEHLNQMTKLEQAIAQYFLDDQIDLSDLSSATISQKLHVSPAALTRFAKKVGFTGYREFIFEYQNARKTIDHQFQHIQKDLTKRVLVDYKAIIDQTNDLVDEDKLERIATLLDKASRVYFYGVGSSGLVARETKIRFMRLGLVCDAVTEADNMIWTNSTLNDQCLVFGLSLTGQTQAILKSLETASQKGAKTVLISAQAPESSQIDDHIAVASVHHLNYGNRISPQFPLLMMIDVLYAYYLSIDKTKKENIFKDTIIDFYDLSLFIQTSHS